MSTLAVEVGRLDATGQADLVRRGEVSRRELVEAAIERIEERNAPLNAVITPLYERAVARAESATGPFAGVPYLLKDLVAEVAGTRFTEGSAFLRDNVSTVDSALVTRLERAGLVIVGKTNTPEFGMVPTCEPLLHGPTRNPWDLTRSTSGSSGGSAAAVAAGMVAMAHGNDLGGSLRYPASACGLFGFKPTRGRISLAPLYGDVVGGWAVEHALTRSVRDSAALLDATAGAEPGDPYPAPSATRPFADEVGVDPGRLRLAVCRRTASGAPAHPDCLAALDDAVALCADLGHEPVESDLPELTPEDGTAIGIVFNAAVAWIVDYWVRHQGREPQPHELEPLTWAYWAEGRALSAEQYLRSVELLQRYTRRLAEYLTDFDAVLSPTLSTPPLPLGEITSTEDEPLRALERGGATVDYAQVLANITGNPAMSVPLWWNGEGLPIGVHVLGRFGAEATLFRLAGQLERARPWAARVPPIAA
ncbi:MAG TPA: amidase [Jatrophihabitans sp.]|nr:amidase [Jatrophihabitans sp.]